MGENLWMPQGKADVVLDTDAFNEIDDQFAIAYLLRSEEKLNTKAIYAAPFFNEKSSSPGDGMEKSYHEILKMLDLLEKKEIEVFRGSDRFLDRTCAPVPSPAVQDLICRAKAYTPENPLYVVAIGAITNIASALLTAPEIADSVVVVWLGGHGQHCGGADEFNMMHDITAARVVFDKAARLVQVPCRGVAEMFTVTRPELMFWLAGKNKTADYLARNTAAEADSYAEGRPWSRTIWDVTAVAWLLNDDGRFMDVRTVPRPMPDYDLSYVYDQDGLPMQYVYHINRDALMEDLIQKLLFEQP